MRFNDDVGLDTSQVSDRRGMRMGVPLIGGGGIIGLIFVLIQAFAGGGTALTPQTYDQGDGTAATASSLSSECQSGADANRQEDCRIVGVVNSVQAYWQQSARNYTEAQTVFFTSGTNTACGAATTEVGPFYCPGDRTVYIDLAFYDELRSQFGATGGPFAEAYVIAHEYGHHVQDLAGTLSSASSQSGASGTSVRTELQADCFAGMWAKNATRTGFISELTQQDIADGLDAAAAVGDDRIQQKARGRVDKESFTHGSAEQRQRWFMNGFNGASTQNCDTFTARTL